MAFVLGSNEKVDCMLLAAFKGRPLHQKCINWILFIQCSSSCVQASIREGAGSQRVMRTSRDAPVSPHSPLAYSPLGFEDALDRGQEAIAEVEMVCGRPSSSLHTATEAVLQTMWTGVLRAASASAGSGDILHAGRPHI